MEPKVTKKKKLNRLVILGNGFDLSLGLKTSYKDFLYNYLKNIIIKIYNKEIYTGIDLSTNRYKFNDGLITLFCPTNETLLDEIKKYSNYDELSKYLRKEKLLSYDFELLENFHRNSINGNWTDIEILYYDELVSIIKRYSGNPIKRDGLIRIYNGKFNKLRINLIKYLSTIKPWWSSNDVRGRDLDSVDSYYFNFFEKEILSSENDDVQINKIMFLNFNYTSTVNDLLNKFNRVENINHIHGKLNDEDSVIFGFDDKMDDNNNLLNSIRGDEVSKFIKSSHYIIYPNYTKLRTFLQKDDYEVYILGHSCGISDRTLLNYIFENNNCKSIRLFYFEKKDSSTDRHDKSIGIMKHTKNKTDLLNKIKPFDKNDKMFQLKKV